VKQGTGNRKAGDQKVEPRGKFVNPGAVSYLGNKLGNHADNKDMTLKPTPFNAGSVPRGSSPGGFGKQGPGAGRNIFKSGTQGKH
jgi:hypothetical protein